MFGDDKFEMATIFHTGPDRLIRGGLAVVALLALAGVCHAADAKCDRGATRSSTVRLHSSGGHIYRQALPLGIQVFQPWIVVSEPPAPRSAHSVLFGR